MRRYLIIMVVMLIGIASCQHKDLCYDHRDHAYRYYIDVKADYRCDWEECCGGTNWQEEWPKDYIPYDDLRPDYPEGLRVVAYNEAGENNIHNIKPEGGVITLFEGPNDLMFYNNDTEYIIFSRNGATTRATTRTRTRTRYEGNKYANSEFEPTLSPPDMLFASYYEDYVPEKVIDPVDFEVTLQPLVYTYKIRYEFKEGLKYVAMAQGALTGMAASVLLNTGETSTDVASLLYDCEVTDYGVRAIVNSFGIPGFPHPSYPTRNENKHGLTLDILLRNGRDTVMEFDVTDQVNAQPHGGVIVVKDLSIPEELGQQGSGAFDVEVDDWGEYENVELPL